MQKSRYESGSFFRMQTGLLVESYASDIYGCLVKIQSMELPYILPFKVIDKPRALREKLCSTLNIWDLIKSPKWSFDPDILDHVH